MEKIKQSKTTPVILQSAMTSTNTKKRNGVISSNQKTTSELVEEIESAKFGSIHSIDDVIESAKRGNGIVEYNDVTITVNNDFKTISIGDVRRGDVLTVPLTNGYRFSFNMNNLNDVRSCLSLFQPEDVRRILQAIAEFNYKKKKEAEIEQDKLYLGEAGDEAKKAKEKKQLSKEDSAADKMEETFQRLRAGNIAASLLYQIKPEEIEAAKQKKEDEEQQRLKESQQKSEIDDELIQLLFKN